MNLFKRNQLMI